MAAASDLDLVLIHPRPSQSHFAVTSFQVARGLLDLSEVRVPDWRTVLLTRSEG